MCFDAWNLIAIFTNFQLKDPLGNEREQKTRKVSCQYPILDVKDQSFTHPDNVKNNTWHVRHDFPTNEFIEEMELQDIPIPKYYEAEAWVTKDESLTFQVRTLVSHTSWEQSIIWRKCGGLADNGIKL